MHTPTRGVRKFVKTTTATFVLILLTLFVFVFTIPNKVEAEEIGANYFVTPSGTVNAFSPSGNADYYTDLWPQYFEDVGSDVVELKVPMVIKYSHLEYYNLTGATPDGILFSNCFEDGGPNYNLQVLDGTLNETRDGVEMRFICPAGYMVMIFNNSNFDGNYSIIVEPYSTTSDITTLGDLSFALAIIITFMFLAFVTFIFNRTFKRKY